MKIIFATGNENKMKEIREIMDDLDCEVLSMKEAGIAVEVEENGETFEENAQIKAREIAKVAKNAIVLADDSGLEIDFLNKEPGVRSSRFMGVDTSYTIKNQHILELLKEAEGDQRSARFVCAIAVVLPNKEEKVIRATIEGQIARESKGEKGFGYDPIFYVPEFECTTAELSMEQKNKISHRGKALAKMKKFIAECVKEGKV